MTRIVRAPNEQPLDLKTLASRPKPGPPTPRVIREKPAGEKSIPKLVKVNSRKRFKDKVTPKALKAKSKKSSAPNPPPIAKKRQNVSTPRSSPQKGKQLSRRAANSKPDQSADNIGRPKYRGSDWETFKKLAVAQELGTRTYDASIRRARAFAKWALNHPYQAGRG